jgi:hypothetical protein
MVALYYAFPFDLAGRAHHFDRDTALLMPKPSTPRQERKAAQREAAERQQRRNALIWRVVIVAVVIGAALYGYRAYDTRRALDAVIAASYPAGMHVAGRIEYKESPPIGGAHNVIWQNCGIYEVPIHNEHAVHALEHGAVWITYRTDLPQDQVQTLRSVAGDDFMLLSPYPGLKAPVVATAWNRQIALDSAGDRRLRRFIDEFKNNPQTTPEFGAPCSGGTSANATADTLTPPAGGMAR